MNGVMQEYTRSVARIDAVLDLQELTSAALCDLGFRSFSLRSVSSFKKDRAFGEFDWRHMEYYHDHQCQRVDPVAQEVNRSWYPVPWDSLSLLDHKGGLGDELYQRMIDIGYERGISFRINGPFAQRFILVAIFDGEARKFARSRQGLIGDVMLLGTHLAEAYDRLNGESSKPLKPLTPREVEVLLWTCQGKTAWEIATVIGVTERTVTFHLHNAVTKLSATTKYAACLKALQLGLISLNN